jgi:hypothetical protein
MWPILQEIAIVLRGDTQEARSLCEVSFVLSAVIITEHNVYLPGASRTKFSLSKSVDKLLTYLFYTKTVPLKTETVHPPLRLFIVTGY